MHKPDLFLSHFDSFVMDPLVSDVLSQLAFMSKPGLDWNKLNVSRRCILGYKISPLPFVLLRVRIAKDILVICNIQLVCFLSLGLTVGLMGLKCVIWDWQRVFWLHNLDVNYRWLFLSKSKKISPCAGYSKYVSFALIVKDFPWCVSHSIRSHYINSHRR